MSVANRLLGVCLREFNVILRFEANLRKSRKLCSSKIWRHTLTPTSIELASEESACALKESSKALSSKVLVNEMDKIDIINTDTTKH